MAGIKNPAYSAGKPLNSNSNTEAIGFGASMGKPASVLPPSMAIALGPSGVSNAAARIETPFNFSRSVSGRRKAMR